MAFALHEVYAEFVEAAGHVVEEQLSLGFARPVCATEAGIARDSRATRNRRRGMKKTDAIRRRKRKERTRAALAEIRAARKRRCHVQSA